MYVGSIDASVEAGNGVNLGLNWRVRGREGGGGDEGREFFFVVQNYCINGF